MWALYALLSAFFASLTAIFAKIGVKDVDTDLATAIRTVVILILAWGIVFFRNGISSMHTLTRYNLTFLVLSGIATGCSWVFYFKALQMGKVSVIAPIDKLSLALTLVLSFVFLKEPMTPRVLAGAGLILAGTLVLVWQ